MVCTVVREGTREAWQRGIIVHERGIKKSVRREDDKVVVVERERERSGKRGLERQGSR